MLAGAGQAAVAAVVEPKMNPNGGGMIVKLALLISKKILPTASTFTRQVVLGVFGTVITSDPSFGVLATSVVNVVPPSVETEIFTFAQLIGATVVPFTDQLTVSVVQLTL